METKLFLSPLAGYTDESFRIICDYLGCDYKYTEMISAKALYYKDKKTKSLMNVHPKDKNTGIQIFGSDPKIMSEVVKMYINNDDRFDSVDINMGCPAPKIVNNNEGSALLKSPLLVGKIVESVVKASIKPVSVKFRSGFNEDNINFLEIGKICQEQGAKYVCLHPRTREQMYRGKANWDYIRELKEVLDIPVIGNGDIFSPEDAKAMIDYTNCDGIQVARGTIGNPFIFRSIKQYLENGKYDEPSIDEIIDVIRLQYNLMEEFKDHKRSITQMRKQIAHYIKGFDSSKKIKDEINKLESKDDIFNLLDEYGEYLKDNIKLDI